MGHVHRVAQPRQPAACTCRDDASPHPRPLAHVRIERSIWELGCNETLLVEIFTSHTQEQLQEGKEQWEGRTDKSLIDYINDNLSSGYKHLQTLLFKLIKGERRDYLDPEVRLLP